MNSQQPTVHIEGQSFSYHSHGLLSPGPFAIPSQKLGMWLFIVADTITFGTLLVAYGYLRLASPEWPHPFAFDSSILTATAMTIVLVTSSLTMVAALISARHEEWNKSMMWLLITIALGALFTALHIHEWIVMYSGGVRFSRNPWGTPLFGATFFGLTGLHMLHIVVGILYLLVVTVLVHAKKITAKGIETAGLYWCFVDLVWMFIFPMVYLMSAK